MTSCSGVNWKSGGQMFGDQRIVKKQKRIEKDGKTKERTFHRERVV